MRNLNASTLLFGLVFVVAGSWMLLGFSSNVGAEQTTATATGPAVCRNETYTDSDGDRRTRLVCYAPLFTAEGATGTVAVGSHVREGTQVPVLVLGDQIVKSGSRLDDVGPNLLFASVFCAAGLYVMSMGRKPGRDESRWLITNSGSGFGWAPGPLDHAMRGLRFAAAAIVPAAGIAALLLPLISSQAVLLATVAAITAPVATGLAVWTRRRTVRRCAFAFTAAGIYIDGPDGPLTPWSQVDYLDTTSKMSSGRRGGPQRTVAAGMSVVTVDRDVLPLSSAPVALVAAQALVDARDAGIITHPVTVADSARFLPTDLRTTDTYTPDLQDALGLIGSSTAAAAHSAPDLNGWQQPPPAAGTKTYQVGPVKLQAGNGPGGYVLLAVVVILLFVFVGQPLLALGIGGLVFLLGGLQDGSVGHMVVGAALLSTAAAIVTIIVRKARSLSRRPAGEAPSTTPSSDRSGQETLRTTTSPSSHVDTIQTPDGPASR